MESGLSLQTRRELLQQVIPQYREAKTVKKKSKLLDAFTAATGYNRKYAMWLFNHAKVGKYIPHRPCPSQYGPEVQHALFLVWHPANRICSKRLMPFLPTLVESLERHKHLHLDSGVPPPTALHELEPQQIASYAPKGNVASAASPRRERAPYSNSRSRSARSPSGTKLVPAFCKRIWWLIVAPTSRAAICSP